MSDTAFEEVAVAHDLTRRRVALAWLLARSDEEVIRLDGAGE
ncbi:hypothetical protein [Halobaculum magnesiiphilum]|nr:hypothetical protein [Halobaculum magnesiiphilum]